MSQTSRRSAPRRAGRLALAAGCALAAIESGAATTLEACIDRLPPGVTIDLAIEARIDTTGEGERLSGTLGVDDGSEEERDESGDADRGDGTKPEYVEPFVRCVRSLLREKHREVEAAPAREAGSLVF